MAPARGTGSPVYTACAGCHHNIRTNMDDDAYESCTTGWTNAVHAVGLPYLDLRDVLPVPVSTSAVLVLQ
ncbi:hypothetical protein D3C76_1680090 [compost metagenome]